jgi:hypothetical protein
MAGWAGAGVLPSDDWVELFLHALPNRRAPAVEGSARRDQLGRDPVPKGGREAMIAKAATASPVDEFVNRGTLERADREVRARRCANHLEGPEHWMLQEHRLLEALSQDMVILRESSFFTPNGLDREPAGFLRDRESFAIGPFTVTPFLGDHSAFDAYSVLIEANGSRLFYSGDPRAHCGRARLFGQLVREPPGDVAVLLIEGTRLGRSPAQGEALNEGDLERGCVDLFRRTDRIVLVIFSMQNIDRLVSLYRASLQADRDFVLDLYGAAVSLATGNPKIPSCASIG